MMMRTLTLLTALVLAAGPALGQELGLRPMDPTTYRRSLIDPKTLMDKTPTTLPGAWNWKDLGAVTPAKNQARCGSCWAFAATGALESHIIIDFGEAYDLSEQAMVSCYGPPRADGCFGGELDALRFFEDTSPRAEACYPYVDGTFMDTHQQAPPTTLGACHSACDPICYKVTGFYTLDVVDPDAVKRSCLRDGPLPMGFDVYEDFKTYWTSPLGTPPWTDGVYFHASGAYLGGHGVLIYGWDDGTSAYLCKNSWGETKGPCGDGSFRMRTDQISEAVNFKVVRGTCEGYPIRLLLPKADLRPPDGPCANADETLQFSCLVRSDHPGRIYGGYWVTAMTLGSGAVVLMTEPIPNASFLTWNDPWDRVFKKTCLTWGAETSMEVEYWLVDTEGVESSHKTVKIEKGKGICQE